MLSLTYRMISILKFYLKVVQRLEYFQFFINQYIQEKVILDTVWVFPNFPGEHQHEVLLSLLCPVRMFVSIDSCEGQGGHRCLFQISPSAFMRTSEFPRAAQAEAFCSPLCFLLPARAEPPDTGGSRAQGCVCELVAAAGWELQTFVLEKHFRRFPWCQGCARSLPPAGLSWLLLHLGQVWVLEHRELQLERLCCAEELRNAQHQNQLYWQLISWQLSGHFCWSFQMMFLKNWHVDLCDQHLHDPHTNPRSSPLLC